MMGDAERTIPNRCRKREIAILFCSVFIAVALPPIAASRVASGQTKAAVQEFSIPSQSLDVALGRYGDLTGREALYDPATVDGRVSSQVEGKFTSDEALQRLLVGAGVSARFVAENSFVIVRAPPPHQPAEWLPAHRRYYGLVQKSLLSALCRSGAGRPGSYRIVAMLWLDANGGMAKSLRIGSAGPAHIDDTIDATLRDMRLSEPPPAGFEQPVSILIVPQASDLTPACAADGRPARGVQ